MANMSDYLENKLIDFVFRAAAYTPPANLYVALCTTTPTDASTGSTIVEPTGGGYARQVVISGTADWYTTQGDITATSTGTSGTTSNVNDLTWSGGTWAATIVAIAICDALTAGNVLFWGATTASIVVASGNTVTISGGGGAGQLSIQLDN